MTVSETVLPDGGYEQRFTVQVLRSEMRFVRRPVSIAPPEGTVCVVDNGPRYGNRGRQTGAAFKGGKWQRCKFEPTHWTDWEEPARG